MEIDTTGVIDIRIVRQWLDTASGVAHSPSCSIKLLAGFEDDTVYLFCLECNDKIYIGLDTYNAILEELNV
jgi:hypothetical protein